MQNHHRPARARAGPLPSAAPVVAALVRAVVTATYRVNWLGEAWFLRRWLSLAGTPAPSSVHAIWRHAHPCVVVLLRRVGSGCDCYARWRFSSAATLGSSGLGTRGFLSATEAREPRHYVGSLQAESNCLSAAVLSLPLTLCPLVLRTLLRPQNLGCYTSSHAMKQPRLQTLLHLGKQPPHSRTCSRSTGDARAKSHSLSLSLTRGLSLFLLSPSLLVFLLFTLRHFVPSSVPPGPSLLYA